MNTFKRKALSCAVLGGLGAVAGTAHAVYQDPSGQGQVLLYPYYTVQQAGGNSYNTYISIVNTTTRGKAVKVRFREGKNSREVLDFNLFLSPNDVWTGAIIPADNTTTSAGRLITGDASCTNPPIPAAGIDFRNYAYVGAQADNAGSGVDRTREGYLEMLEMATVNNVAPLNALTAITHTSAGVPTNCTAVQSSTLATSAPAGTFTAPSGGLNGSYTLINVANGADAGGNAHAFSNFRSTAGYTDIGDETFNLSSGDPVSVVVNTQPTGTTAYLATFTNPVDAVSATMMHTNVINEYVLDDVSRSNTDWVMTFPTKRFYVTATAATTPFTNKFTANGACELISFTFFNREERGATAALGDFSPSLPGVSDALCWESTVMSLRNGRPHMPTTAASGVLGSLNSQTVNVTTGFQNGWGNLSFTGTNAATVGITSVAGAGFSNAINVNTGLASTAAQNYRGLPVIGFMVRNLNNLTLTCTNTAGTANAACQGTYGSLFDHKFNSTITPAP